MERRSFKVGANLNVHLLCGILKASVVCVLLIIAVSGCSSSYRPPARPYYAYPPPAPSIPEPATPQSNTASPQTSPGQIPGKGSPFLEKTLEDSSSPATSKPALQDKTSDSMKTTTKKETPQVLASVRLVDDARQMRVKGKVDEAIRLLERAIEVDAYNGEAFYELALCWKAKGDIKKALSFADRSERIFAGNPEKLKKVYLLKTQLFDAAGKKEEAQKYRQKAR
ncbi:MAG: tetratricopeptide repeat protein [Thermodesulforhabdaceae bacterium]